MKRTKRGQSSVEFLLIVSLALFLLIPALAVFTDFIQKTSGDVIVSHVEEIGNTMVANVQTVYFHGPGAMIVLDVNMPENVVNMTVENDNFLIITVKIEGRTSDFLFYSDAPMQANITSSYFSPGLKHMKIEAIEGGVLLERIQQ